jgi:hypothetical protein
MDVRLRVAGMLNSYRRPEYQRVARELRIAVSTLQEVIAPGGALQEQTLGRLQERLRELTEENQ